jgi:hypothetical protein
MDFKPMYQSLLLYRKDFSTMLDFLSENNERNIPKCTNKEGGLIKNFLSKIPFHYGDNIWNSFSNQRYNNMDEFLKPFYKEVNYHNRAYIKNKAHSYAMISDPNEKSKLAQEETGIKPLVKPYHKLNAIDNDSDSSEIESSVLPSRKNEYTPPEFSDSDPLGLIPEKLPQDQTDFEFLQLIQPLSNKSEPKACYKELLYNDCKESNCKYSHDRQILTKKATDMHALLEKSKYLSKPMMKPKLSNILLRPSTQDRELSSESFSQQMHNILMHISPEANCVQSVHKDGWIAESDNIINVAHVLFDSGALHASYVSKKFADQYRNILINNFYPIHSAVKLADNKTVINITEQLVVHICFRDAENIVHSGTVQFMVLETRGYDIIIGLPAILNTFSKLFISMIMNAADSLCSITPELQTPWEHNLLETAAEDEETPLPTSFTSALHFMEVGYEAACQEFLEQVPEHVAAEFAANTDILHLLETKGVNVFVPQNWEGINNLEPFELNWRPDLPTSMKPKARPVNPKLFEHAQVEFERLSKYFYIPSTSPVASCLVIAPKATKPFIRFCGDYVSINKYIDTGHYPIPHVQHSLQKICKFKIFLDFDWVNSFHQIKLGPITSSRLSVQTPWGQVQPLFMPEGIGPASGKLQSVVAEIFQDYDEWTIAIFDNLLALAHDFEDAYKKVNLILDRCIERNLYLKFSKTWLGFNHANFFGYLCKFQKYELSDSRKDSIMSMVFPRSQKEMQSFLGATLYFKSFVPAYSDKAAPLYEMTKSDFNWKDISSWKQNYEFIFNAFKAALLQATSLYYPDYELDWILRVDASTIGVAAALFMRKPPTDPSDCDTFLPISFASKKFSPQAIKWSTIEQEAFACYFGVNYFDYYLRCKEFVLETDHNNLVWIQASNVPKIVRWRIYLQSFNFMIRHIPGKENNLADHLSRSFVELSNFNSIQNKECDVSSELLSPGGSFSQFLPQVHNGRLGHFGAKATYNLLNKHFPGHGISLQTVQDFINQCPICQKDRLGLSAQLEPISRHLKPPHFKSVIGSDTLTVTPVDEYGNSYLTVIVNHFTKHCYGYPSAKHDSLSTASAIFQYCCTFGLADTLITDPGSEFTADIIQYLTKWLGIRHIFSLVDRHQSNGVEGSNKQILRHLKALVFDERLIRQWSSPTVLPLIFFILNSNYNSETGTTPFSATFGDAAATYFKLPESGNVPELFNSYLSLLNDNLVAIRSLSYKYQQALIKKRSNTVTEATQNKFQPGDLVLFQLDPSKPLPSKLSPKFLGPYSVIQQIKNDVQCKHVNLGRISTLHVERLKPFFGTLEDAKTISLIDENQYIISSFMDYRGDPLLRTTLEFLILFADSSKVWLPYSKDISDTLPFEEFCRANLQLYSLLFTADAAKTWIREINRKAITEIIPGDKVYVDLRSYGASWFQNLELPFKPGQRYVIHYEYRHFSGKLHNHIHCYNRIFDEDFIVDHLFVFSWGQNKLFDNLSMVLIDIPFVLAHPKVLPDNSRQELLNRYSKFS